VTLAFVTPGLYRREIVTTKDTKSTKMEFDQLSPTTSQDNVFHATKGKMFYFSRKLHRPTEAG
jgi:hypothetical protein